MSGLDLAVVGNCAWGGLIDTHARLVWACFPRFDSDPLFPALLDGDGVDDGVFAIALEGVKGAEQHPLYAALTGRASPFPGDVKWNFSKFLIGRDGKIIKRFEPQVTPDAAEVVASIESALSPK